MKVETVGIASAEGALVSMLIDLARRRVRMYILVLTRASPF